MSAIPYRNLNSQASLCQPTKSISVESNRQPDVSPDSGGNLHHASVLAAEMKRLILIERRGILHRGTWMALSTLAEVCTHLLIALERLSAGEK